ncbi:hypothetical protein DUE52_30115 [Larkinella punicea]|uniref:Uncharacterized protein n=1 Tax=Larkinella punicea TaxID=2315727 RepID=A0A368JEW1_9BACT|nr:hypothetical protein DUE52_30115 [Larkinella punicea]
MDFVMKENRGDGLKIAILTQKSPFWLQIPAVLRVPLYVAIYVFTGLSESGKQVVRLRTKWFLSVM